MTCGLRNSENPTSGNLTPQETTKQATLEVGPEGAGLSCPGISVVADEKSKAARFESPDAPETIGPDRSSLLCSQSLTEEAEADETPIKTDGTR